MGDLRLHGSVRHLLIQTIPAFSMKGISDILRYFALGGTSGLGFRGRSGHGDMLGLHGGMGTGAGGRKGAYSTRKLERICIYNPYITPV